MGVLSDRYHAKNGWVVVIALSVGLLQAEDIRMEITQTSAKICCLAVEKPSTLADRTVRAGPRKDPLWSSRGIMKILLVDRYSLERVYGGGRISISQGRDVDASTMTPNAE